MNARRQCEGYATPNETKRVPGSTFVLVNYGTPASKQLTYSPDPAAGPNLISRDPLELRSIDFFRLRTAPQLAGWFGTELWSRHVLQTAYHEPAIRHAVVALGAMHEQFELLDNANAVYSQYGMQQYGKSIQTLVKAQTFSDQQSEDVALLSCCLYTAFESLQGHYLSAITHIKSGMDILAANPDATNLPGSYVPRKMFIALLMRFDSQVLQLGNQSMMTAVDHIENEFKNEILPDVFGTIEEAQASFDRLLYQLGHFFQSEDVMNFEKNIRTSEIMQRLTTVHTIYTRYFGRWCSAFDKYLVLHLTSSPKSDTGSGQPQPAFQVHPGVLVLQIWRNLLDMMLRIDLMKGETGFDQFLPIFTRIVELGESFLIRTATYVPHTSPESAKSSPRDASMGPPKDFNDFITIACATNPVDAKRAETDRVSSHGFMGMLPGLTPILSNRSAPVDARNSPIEESSSRQRDLPLSKPTFTLGLGILSPLYVASSRCRDPVLRRRALRVLELSKRREGVWDSVLVFRTAARIVQIEEGGALPLFDLPLDQQYDSDGNVIVYQMSQIPEESRVRDLEPIFGPERTGVVRYGKSDVNLTGGPTITSSDGRPKAPKLVELITW